MQRLSVVFIFVAANVLLVVPGFLAGQPVYPDKAKLLEFRDDDGKVHPVKTPADWAKRRAHILANMQKVMGPLPVADAKVPLDVQFTGEVKTDAFVRKRLTFAVAKGERVRAFLLVPHGIKGKRAAVLCLHQTNGKLGADSPAGLGGPVDLHYAVHLAERGYVTLAPDYPSFGEYDFDFAKSPFASGSMKAIWNNMRAVDVLQGLAEVDGQRIGCIGHSLGGHNAMFTAVFDSRIGALVSNCGFTSFPKYYKGNLKGWTSARYMPRIATEFQLKAEKVPFDFPEVVAALAPRAFLASAPLGDANFDVGGVKDCLTAAEPVYELLGARDKLAGHYPDCKHEFPPAVREVAYRWLDRWLEHAPSKKRGQAPLCEAPFGPFRQRCLSPFFGASKDQGRTP
jgi:acetyl esterase/lipase